MYGNKSKKKSKAKIQNIQKMNETKRPPSYNVLKEVQKVTTVHGTSQFGSKDGKSLALWCGIILGNVALTVFFLIVIKEKFNENQIVTQINANCKVNQVPFPAVSICNFNMVSMRESQNIQRILEQNNRSESEITEFFNSFPNLNDYDKNSRNLPNFTDIMKILKQHYFTMDTILEEVHQKCESLLLSCSFNRKPMECDKIFKLIKTLEGYCCAFNYAALNDDSEQLLISPDLDFEYYDDQNDGTSSSRIIMTSESGSSSGLSAVLNFEPDDYNSWSSVPFYGAKVMITDPNDYIETTFLYRYIGLGESVDVKVEAMVFQSDSDIRRVEPEKRGCWFFDEVLLEHTDRYSYETCNTECKMKTYLDSCGCIPYKYPREKENRICEFEDLKCLNNVTVYKSKKEMNCQSICYIECRDKKYTMTSDLVPFLADGLPLEITKNINTSELAALQVYFGKSNCNCYRMSLLIDVNYFIATYGGVFSLSFGASILTLFEFSLILLTATSKSIWKAIINVYTKNK